MEPQFNHEKLRVYQHGLRFVAWTAAVLGKIERKAAVLDHLDRAAESVVESIANGNSRRSTSDRSRYFDVALGSGLECAACLDVSARKQLVSEEAQGEGKGMLLSIVRMTVKLRAADSPAVREEGGQYRAGPESGTELLFFHETLDVYQRSLAFVGWLDGFLRQVPVPPSYATKLDKTSTSLVLNIAEGNGRYSSNDHRRFLDIAHTCVINTASGLDLLVARGCLKSVQIADGKRILGGVVAMLLGLRGYCDHDKDGEQKS